ncbi:MAG: HlyC/CorC family transporter [Victivallales bacterium]|nr:HlyC/CorC family transporter [Victivallales bacterium]
MISIIILLFLSAFFSGSETALMSLSRTEVSRMSNGTPSDKLACQLLKKPQQLLSTVLIGNMFVNVLLTSVFSTLLAQILSTPDGSIIQNALQAMKIGATTAHRLDRIFQLLLNIMIVTPMLMIVGEQTPKVLAYANGPAIARTSAKPLQVLNVVLKPFSLLLHFLANMILALLGQNIMESWREMTIDELIATISAGQEAGATDNSEHKILSGTVEISGITVKEVMTHRLDVTMLSDEISVSDAFSIAMEKRHSLFPVYSGDYDSVWGVFSLMSLPFWRGKPEMNKPLKAFKDSIENASPNQLPVSKPYYVPETAKIDALLYDMRRKAASFGIVVDEYGGISGIVTLNDIMEELLGKVTSKYDNEDTLYKTDNGTFIANGHAHLRTLHQKLGEAFENEEGESDTLAGLIMEEMGTVPKSGSSVKLDDGTILTVLRMQGSRICKVRITPPAPKKEVHQ